MPGPTDRAIEVERKGHPLHPLHFGGDLGRTNSDQQEDKESAADDSYEVRQK